MARVAAVMQTFDYPAGTRLLLVCHACRCGLGYRYFKCRNDIAEEMAALNGPAPVFTGAALPKGEVCNKAETLQALLQSGITPAEVRRELGRERPEKLAVRAVSLEPCARKARGKKRKVVQHCHRNQGRFSPRSNF